MRVRHVGQDELHRLRQLRLQALLDAPQAFGRRYEEEADREPNEYLSWVMDGSTLVAEDDTGWHGLAVIQPDRQEPSVCHLLSMWTEPAWRRQGLGRMLVEAGVAWASEQKAGSVRLGVVEDNQTAIELYQHLGFQPTGEREPLRSDLAKWVVFMSLDLATDA